MASIRVIVRGGIGAGKSAVTELFAERGATVISADAIGHAILQADGQAFDAVATRWPEVVVDGSIDRAALGAIVFADSEALRELESMTHPAIRNHIQSLVDQAPGPVVVELPLPSHFLDGDWVSVVVDAPIEVRRRRLHERGMDPADIEARMAAQPSRLEWLSLADVVIDNGGDLETLRRSAAEAWEAILDAS